MCVIKTTSLSSVCICITLEHKVSKHLARIKVPRLDTFSRGGNRGILGFPSNLWITILECQIGKITVQGYVRKLESYRGLCISITLVNVKLNVLFLALRIYCWRLRTKIVSLIKKPHNPIDTKTLKQLSSSFGTPKQNLCYYRSTMGSISFWSCVWIINIYPQITPFCSSKHSTFPLSLRPHKKRTASVAC